MNDFLNSNRLLSESICSDNIAGVRTALDRGAHLSGVVLLDDNMHTVECAVLNLPLNQAFNEKGLKSKMLLQVHDELVFEVRKEEEQEVRKIVKDLMENTYQLDVPLKVDIETGDNWYEAK